MSKITISIDESNYYNQNWKNRFRLALIAAILKTFIMNSNFDGWKLTTSAFRSGLYFPAEFLGDQGFLRLYN